MVRDCIPHIYRLLSISGPPLCPFNPGELVSITLPGGMETNRLTSASFTKGNGLNGSSLLNPLVSYVILGPAKKGYPIRHNNSPCLTGRFLRTAHC